MYLHSVRLLSHELTAKQLINCSPPGFGSWIAHVQGSSAVISQCSGQDDETATSRLFRRQLKFVTVSVLTLEKLTTCTC